jgi:amidase
MRFLFIGSFIFLHLIQSIRGQTTNVKLDSLYKSRTINFIPTSFSNKFSLNITPVLRIHAGDTVRTETIDALGRDKNGVRRHAGGNPLTGPFYIEDSEPGDVLQITLIKISLNRAYAYTTESFASRSMPDSVTRHFKKPHLVKWKLDLENGFAFPDSSFTKYENLKDFRVPLSPFLGCIGVAPSNKRNEILSFFPGKLWGEPGL